MNQKQVYLQLEALSKKSDPWEKTQAYDRKATQNLLQLIQSVPHESILEVGCGYGMLTKELTKIATYVTAIDVSKSAIEKAKKNAPRATCLVVDLKSFVSEKTFDVIVCSEVLYYIKDTKIALTKLQKLGKHLVTSHFFIYFPAVCLGSVRYEIALRKFYRMRIILEWSFKERYLVKKTLFKLHA